MKRFSWIRVWGVIMRHIYNFRRTFDRVVDAFYWPSLDIIIWGLTFSAISKDQGGMSALYITNVLLGVILWYVVWRGQYEITVNFLEELWSENTVNLFSSPLTLAEWTVALLSLGFLKLFLTVTFTATLAWFLYAVNIFRLGFLLIPFLVNLLVVGWWFGLFVSSMFLRWGTKVQSLAWAGGYLMMPFSAVFYPLASLPIWMQRVAVWLPTTYVFEGMRMAVETGFVPMDMIVKSVILNMMYFALMLILFISSFQRAKVRGLGHLR
jgi:ABC-2 type transport system permease protein